MNLGMFFYDHSIKCEFCEATFDDQDLLKKHLRLHSRRKPYECNECDAKFSYNSTLEWHKKSHTGEMPFKCDECGVQFVQNSMLVWHKRKHRIGEASQGPSSLVVNMANIYHQVPVPEAVLGLSNIASQVIPPMPINMVATCSSQGADMATSHLHMHSGLLPGMQPAESASGLKRKLEGEEGTFRCDICGAVMRHSFYLKTHMSTKHNMGENNPFHLLARQQEANGQVAKKKIILEKAFKCDLCGAGFNTEGHLKTHRQKHLVAKPFKCEKCGVSFCERDLLESHERRHQAERPFKCERCGAAFFRESHLHRHIKRHTGEIV